MNITTAEHSHIESIAFIVKSTFHLACPKDSNRDLQSAYISKHLSCENFKQILSSDNHNVWVALDKKEPIGLAVLERLFDESAMLSKLYVLPAYHGNGVAYKLCSILLKYVKETGIKNLSLTVYSENLKAKSFYEKLGFKLVGEIDFRMETELHKDHVYAYPIL